VREYELIYILHPDITPEREQEIHSVVDDVITKADGLLLVRDDWGKRKLAYEIQKFQKGHYFLLTFLGAGIVIPELERGFRLDADVLRFLSVQKTEKVADVEARVAWGKEEAEAQARRREERDQQERERAERERERAANAVAAAPSVAEPIGTGEEAPTREVAPVREDPGAADEPAAAKEQE